MNKEKEALLAEIELTLDQLIRNAEAAEGLSLQILDKSEIAALYKTQGSLCARLMHREKLLRSRIEHTAHLQQKVERFKRLNERLMKEMSRRFKPVKLRKSRLNNKERPVLRS